MTPSDITPTPLEASEENTVTPESVFRTLAITSMVKKAVDIIEKPAKQYVATHQLLDEGEKTTATAGGNPVATISRTVSGAPTYTISDPAAFANWIATNHVSYPLDTITQTLVTREEALRAACTQAGINLDAYIETTTTYTIPEWATSPDVIASMLETTNPDTLPDGLTEKKGRHSTITVRQSKQQRNHLLRMIPPVKELITTLNPILTGITSQN